MLVPIRVGMILRYQALANCQHPCPHTRGDDPIPLRQVGTQAPLVPIRVGMIPEKPLNKAVFKSCPHTRGDDPLL